MRRYLQCGLLAAAGLACSLLSGCQLLAASPGAPGFSKSGSAPGPYVQADRAQGRANTGEAAAHAAQGNEAILSCQRDLDSLRLVNAKAWSLRKADFDALVAGVSVYASVRGSVNGKTRDTLDSLYRYKTNQICAQIERDVLDGLISRGESIR